MKVVIICVIFVGFLAWLEYMPSTIWNLPVIFIAFSVVLWFDRKNQKSKDSQD